MAVNRKKHDIDELAAARRQIEELARFPQENPNPVFRVDGKGTILYANAACSRLDFLQCQPGQRLSAPYREIAAKVLRSGKNRIVETSGKGHVFALDFVPIMAAGYVNVYGSDINRRKKSEEDLEKYRAGLAQQVKERTAELLLANERLRKENEERLRTEQTLRLEEARLDALLRLSQMDEASINEVAAFLLERSIALTQSKIGFVGFLSEDESVYTLNAVSKDVVKECRVKGDPLQWHVTGAGIWADAIRKRRTLFVNDYSQPYPGKKGLPPGHPPVNRLMVVPLFDGKKIVAVAGMGNKESDYDESDERQITLLLRGMWNHALRNRSREELQKAYGELEGMVKERTTELQEAQRDLNRAQAVAQTGNWRLDVRRNVLLWSDETYRMFGIPRGKPMTYETFLSAVHPEDKEYVDKKWNEALQGEGYDIEHRIIVGGKVRWVREKAELEWDRKGMLKGGFGTVQDITERKMAEEDLRRTRDYLDNLITYANAPIIVWDPDLKITRFNHAFEILTGHRASDMLGKRVDILIPADQREEALQKINRDTLQGERWEIVEIPVQHIDGSVRTVLWNSAILYEADGKTPMATIAQGQDITELKKIDQMKDEFIGLVSHELRTPLTIVTGSLQSALTPGISPDESRELLQNAIAGVDSLAAILENMLELSRYQAGRLQIYIEPVDVAVVARSVIKKLKGQGAGQRFTVVSRDKCPPAEADPVRVERILYNLLENATKYSPSGSEIKVSCRKEGDFVVTRVTDRGKGIPVKDQGRLFELFEQLERGTRQSKGLGLGLVVCKRLVEAQVGWIKVSSAPRKGSTFSFGLPVLRKKA
jgi:PAS domain S-box-containing protein